MNKSTRSHPLVVIMVCSSANFFKLFHQRIQELSLIGPFLNTHYNKNQSYFLVHCVTSLNVLLNVIRRPQSTSENSYAIIEGLLRVIKFCYSQKSKENLVFISRFKGEVCFWLRVFEGQIKLSSGEISICCIAQNVLLTFIRYPPPHTNLLTLYISIDSHDRALPFQVLDYLMHCLFTKSLGKYAGI